ncbi:MAG: hypothetical protein E7390_01295 [Ruminococcaceae bacterium]|nr:hypothetical protein [Oscillospiraceae bacterium]
MKKLLLTMVTLVMLLLATVYPTAAENREILVYMDGVKVEFDVKPQIIDGRTMVPIRAIFEKMGAFVEWDEAAGSAICTKGSNTVKMTLNSMDMYINDRVVAMDISPVVIDGRTLAPARYAAEAFGATVEWSREDNAVLIYSGNADGYVAENMVKLYALDGRTTEVPEGEVSAYLLVGWYRTKEETQQTLYAPDGRTMTVYKAEVPTYTSLGWYENRHDVLTSGKTASTSNTANSGNSVADGYYYRTPTGKRYHLDPDCGGKNSYRTTNISGLTPCAKCAK